MALAAGGRLRSRPPGLVCSNCMRRMLRKLDLRIAPRVQQLQLIPGLVDPDDRDTAVSDEEVRVFTLKLRDWLAIDRIECRPCLSVCPKVGITVERRGKTMVLDPSAIIRVHQQFDPTRQLGFEV